MTVSVPALERLLAGDWKWRVGRKLHRTVYRQFGPEPSDDDALIGLLDHEDDAALICEAVTALPALIAAVKAARVVADSEGVEECSTKGREALIALDEALAPFSFEGQA